MSDQTVTRVIEWIAAGFEGAYTQYTVTSSGMLHVVQISTIDNMSRALSNPEPLSQQFASFATAMHVMEQLIANRTEDGAAVELNAQGKPVS